MELEKTVEDVKKHIDEKIEKSDEKIEALKSEHKAEIDALKSENESKIEELKNDIKELSKTVVKSTKPKQSPLSEKLDEIFSTEKFIDFQNGRANKSGAFELTEKAISVTSNLTGGTHVITRPNDEVRINEVKSLRDEIPVIDVEADGMAAYSYLEITDIKRNSDVTSENGDLHESSFKVNEKVAEVKRIGSYLQISKRMLRSISTLKSFIMTFLQNALNIAENFQLIFGDGNGNNIKGIINYAISETKMTGEVYDIAASEDNVSSIELLSDGSTRFNFASALPNLQTGMKVTIALTATKTAYNNTFEIRKINDNSFTIPFQVSGAVIGNFDTSTFKFKYDFANSKHYANKFDAIETAIGFQTFGQYRPTVVLINPLEHDKLRGIKDRVGRKLYNDYVVSGKIAGATLIDIAAVPTGKALIGDFVNGLKLFDCQKATLEFAEDRESKRKNFVELQVQEEIIFAVEVPEAFMYMDLATVQNAINITPTSDINVTIMNEELDVKVTNADEFPGADESPGAA